jgi:predicted secreted protein
MKSKAILTLITIVSLVGVITSCKKGQSPDLSVVKINALDSGKTITVLNGQKLKLSLGNPGDGGYTFKPAQYNSSLLKLNSHTNIPPLDKMVVGDFGTDVWEFSALRPGSAALIITAARGPESPVIEFSVTITVK